MDFVKAKRIQKTSYDAGVVGEHRMRDSRFVRRPVSREVHEQQAVAGRKGRYMLLEGAPAACTRAASVEKDKHCPVAAVDVVVMNADVSDFENLTASFLGHRRHRVFPPLPIPEALASVKALPASS